MIKAKKKVKVVAKKKAKTSEIKASWLAVGVDVSYYSISAAAFAWDKTLNRHVGPAAISIRWDMKTDYFKRLKDAAYAHDLVHELQSQLKVVADTDEVYFAIEEAVAWSHMKKGASGVEKQQMQISGALMGGLLRWGYSRLWEIPANKWRKMVADEIGQGLTIHGSKWNNPEFAPPKEKLKYQKGKIGKFRGRQWCREVKGWTHLDWPDIINHSTLGMIPRPETSTAQGVQADDRFEAIPMAWVQALELGAK
jgi:hypothetical protein